MLIDVGHVNLAQSDPIADCECHPLSILQDKNLQRFQFQRAKGRAFGIVEVRQLPRQSSPGVTGRPSVHSDRCRRKHTPDRTWSSNRPQHTRFFIPYAHTIRDRQRSYPKNGLATARAPDEGSADKKSRRQPRSSDGHPLMAPPAESAARTPRVRSTPALRRFLAAASQVRAAATRAAPGTTADAARVT